MERSETGQVARVLASACEVPAWERVARVVFAESGARFEYADGRVPYVLPVLTPVS